MRIAQILALFLCTSFFTLQAQNVQLVQIASGFSQPVDIVNAGDERLFIVERAGRIRIIENGTTLSTPFLNITSNVNDDPNERGLLGLEFHPDYATNGYFYINYTRTNGDSRISRYSVDPNNPNMADPNSEMIIIEMDQPFWNHNAGDLAFGPDGYLYIGTGDGGSGGDPGNRSQNPQNLLGKMLRIDVDNGSPYAIPADNPFVNDSGTLDEIWALGLRNPWRYSFDSETGDLWIGDVGQNAREEIDFEPANSGGGLNYGWRCYEANAAYNTSGCGGVGDYVAPVVDYAHGNFEHCSVTGGFVYRGCEYPDIVGHYIFADYCSGRFWSTTPDGNDGWTTQEVGSFPGYDISTFGEDVNGELYVARLTQGRIYKITTDATVTIEILQDENVLTGPMGYDSYQWYLNGEAISGAITNMLEISETGDYVLEVSLNSGCMYSSEVFAGVVGVESLATVDVFEINPNPFTDNLTLSFQTNASIEATIEVVDINGKTLMSRAVQLNGHTTEELKLAYLSAGIYFINLRTEEGTAVSKVVKE